MTTLLAPRKPDETLEPKKSHMNPGTHRMKTTIGGTENDDH